jgi:hypothetical protein
VKLSPESIVLETFVKPSLGCINNTQFKVGGSLIKLGCFSSSTILIQEPLTVFGWFE